MDGPRLSLVLPAYNEEANIRQAIAEADTALARLCLEYEILVIDDGSRDATFALATGEAARFCDPAPLARAEHGLAALPSRVRVLRHESNRGYGAALRTGFEAARFDLVAFTDSDCQFHLDDLGLLLERTQDAPIVVGCRLDRQDPWRRRFLSRGYNLLARTLLGTRVRDCDCALKVFRKADLSALLPESPGFFVNAEILARARMLGLEVAEVGVRHRPRLGGQSSVSLREVPRTLGCLLPFWWSRVVFAGDTSPLSPNPSPQPPPGRSREPSGTLAPPLLAGEGAGGRGSSGAGGRGSSAGGRVWVRRGNWLALLLLLFVAGLLFFSRLHAPLLEPQEARYAEIPRQMLQQGRFLVPTLHEQPYLDKPPLLYWSVMASYRIFGIHDWSARVVPGLAGLLTVLAAWLWGRRLFGARAGLCGALILCLAPEFVYRARMLTFDTLLTLWVVIGLAAAHTALASPRLLRRWWLCSAAACGLGLLTKGPVALVLVAGPLLALSLLDPRLARPRWRDWAGYLALAVAVAAPWYVAVMLAVPDFAGYFFWKHNVLRFLVPFDHARTPWFYLPGLLIGLLPWTLLVPGMIRLLARRGTRSAARRPAALGFVLFCFVWMLLFFSAAGSKRPTYLLPALPPLALALGWYVHLCAPAWRLLYRRGSRLAAANALVVLAGGATVALTATALQVVKPHVGLTLAGAALTCLVALVLCRRLLSWAATAALTFVVLLLAVQHLQPAYNRQFALRGPLRSHAPLAESTTHPVVCYPQRFDSVGFYLPDCPVRCFTLEQQRELIDHLREHTGTLLLVKSGPVLQHLLQNLPPDMVFITRQRGGAITVGRVVCRGVAPSREVAHH